MLVYWLAAVLCISLYYILSVIHFVACICTRLLHILIKLFISYYYFFKFQVTNFSNKVFNICTKCYNTPLLYGLVLGLLGGGDTIALLYCEDDGDCACDCGCDRACEGDCVVTSTLALYLGPEGVVVLVLLSCANSAALLYLVLAADSDGECACDCDGESEDVYEGSRYACLSYVYPEGFCGTSLSAIFSLLYLSLFIVFVVVFTVVSRCRVGSCAL